MSMKEEMAKASSSHWQVEMGVQMMITQIMMAMQTPDLPLLLQPLPIGVVSLGIQKTERIF